ncbi:unnamed protein product [Prunus armeniaca]
MAKHPMMIQYLDKIQELFEGIPYHHHSTSSPGREHTCRYTSKPGISAGHPVQTFNSGRAPWSVKHRRVLCKIHDGKCDNHSEGRSLVHKALNIGYFLPTMHYDSMDYVRRCDRCQCYKLVLSLLAEVYHPQNNPCPFMQWAIDLVGPMSPTPAKKDMIFATDYFTKWIEAKTLSSTKEADVE